jgi:hypothetical protein
MANSFFTGTDAELYTGSAAFSTKITASPTAFGLVAAQATAYAAKNSAYAAAYVEAVDPETRTKGKVEAKNEAKRQLRLMAGDLAKIIDGTPTVTNEQKIDLGLNVRSTPTPIPAPLYAPDIDIVSVSGNTVRLKLHDSTSSTRRGRPPGVDGAAVFSFVGAAAPTDPADWKFEGNTTRTTTNVTFPGTVAPGAKVWFTAFWFNPRAQSGPSATPVTTNIAGGSAMAA